MKAIKTADYCGDDRRANSGNGVVKVWQFVAAQVILFIALLSFGNGFVSSLKAEIINVSYPKERGFAIEQSILEIKATLLRIDKIVGDLRVLLARRSKKNV